MLCSVPGDNPGRKTSFHLGEDFECWRGGCPKCSKASLLSTFRSGPAASVWSCISGHPFSSPSPQHTLALSPSLKATHVDHGHHRQSNQVTAEHLCLHCSLNTALLYKRSKVNLLPRYLWSTYCVSGAGWALCRPPVLTGNRATLARPAVLPRGWYLLVARPALLFLQGR